MDNSYFVYAIASLERNYIYVGLTANVIQRVKTHQSKRNKTTKAYTPFCLIFTEKCQDRKQARIREKYWKAASEKRKLKVLRKKIFETYGFELPD